MIYFQILVSFVIVSVIPSVWADRDSGENVKQRRPTKATTTSSTATTTTPAQITTTPPSTTTSTATSTTPTTMTEQPTSATTTETTITTTPATTTTATPTTTTTTPTTTTTTPATTTTTTPTTTTTTPTTTTTSGAPSGQCGVSDVATGTSADTCATYPWIVRLDISGFAVCVGAILDATHILTAAHCVSEAASITAYVGEYDASVAEGTEQILDVDMANGVSYHPKFSYDNKNYDVAVLTLSSPIDFTRPCAAPVCVAASYHVTPGQTCQTAGWAVVNFVVNDIRESAPVNVYPGANCATAFPFAQPGYFTDPSTQLCAEQACATNGGGPLFCLDDVTNTWNLVGVTSYGEGCDAPGSPGVYTDVSVVYDWIQQQL